MSLPPARLTAAQKKFYDEQGYLLGLPPIFTKDEMLTNGERHNLLALLKPGESTNEMREWHHESTHLPRS